MGLGDIFFGFNGNKYEYAIDISSNRLFKVNSYNGISNKPGTYYGTSIAPQVGAWEIGTGDDLGLVDEYSFKYWPELEENPMQGIGNTYVFEFAFDAGRIEGFSDYNSVGFHNTLECGNDVIDESYSSIPEPTTILLFGLGTLGLAAIRRRRK